jgi:parallel beta-helix repeat protein
MPRVWGLLLLGALAGALPAQPDHIFVYVDGSAPGPGTGTATDPFVTIQDALVYAWPHDFVLVRPGVYHEAPAVPFFVFLRSTDGPGRTVIDATGLPGDHAVTLEVLAELTGFTVTKADGGGVYAEAQGGGPEYGRIIRGNVIRGCAGHGLHLVGSLHPTVVENTVHHNGGAGLVTEDSASPYVAGNTFAHNAAGHLHFGAAPDAQAVFANSIFHANAAAVAGLPPARYESCIIADPLYAGVNGNLALDPLFADGPAGDYRLQAGSPAVDQGLDSRTPYSSLFDGEGYGHLRRQDGDHDGLARVDIGAYERGGLLFRQFGTGSGSLLTLEIDAVPGATVLLAAGTVSDNPDILPGVAGYLMLQPAGLLLLPAWTQPATGLLQLAATVADPAILGLRIPFQALSIDPGANPPHHVLTNLEVVHVR